MRCDAMRSRVPWLHCALPCPPYSALRWDVYSPLITSHHAAAVAETKRLILFGQEGMPVDFAPQLFNVTDDPFELRDVAAKKGDV